MLNTSPLCFSRMSCSLQTAIGFQQFLSHFEKFSIKAVKTPLLGHFYCDFYQIREKKRLLLTERRTRRHLTCWWRSRKRSASITTSANTAPPTLIWCFSWRWRHWWRGWYGRGRDITRPWRMTVTFGSK